MAKSTKHLTRPLGKAMIVGMWVTLLGLLTWFFSDFLDAQYNPNQQVATSIGAGGVAETVLQRNRYGHYVATGAINGAAVRFLVDTGASDVNIPASVAEKLALKRGSAHSASTANGTITVYATRLDKVRLGEIVLHNVRASINPHMRGEDILLGMSFLKDLELVQRGDKLSLRQYGR
jgi:aspartyl protease family protein